MWKESSAAWLNPGNFFHSCDQKSNQRFRYGNRLFTFDFRANYDYCISQMGLKYTTWLSKDKNIRIFKEYISQFCSVFLKETSMWIVCDLGENIFKIFSSDLLQPFKRQPDKMVKQTQTILRQQPMNCLNVYDHLVGLSWTHAKKTFMRSPN